MYERTSKETHCDTLWYEMDMLEFSYREFEKKTFPTGSPQWNLLIEGFLLHYRNLIQFFSGNEERHKRYKGNDLSTSDPRTWAQRELTQAEIDAIKVPGEKLDRAYSNKISNLLQHCTVVRVEPLQGWEMDRMYKEIEPIMNAFAKSFPRRPSIVTVTFDCTGASTASVTVYKPF
jgi:hypothetical protein